jgi:tRNA G18 (ribose-2'-O)-methylase SpoU
MMVRIEDPADPRVAGYIDVRDADLAGRASAFMAEGRQVVRTLLESSRFAARSVLVNDAAWASLSDALSARPEVAVYVASQAVMDAVVGFHIHRGCLALADRGAELDPDGILEDTGDEDVVLALEGINNHDNVGGCFRSALAFGARAVLLDEASADPLYRKAIRVSMGATLRLPFARVSGDLVDALSRRGFAVVALTPAPDATPIDEATHAVTGRCALVVGAEGPGLSPAVLDRAHVRVRIPIVPGVDSLNVATAAGIALHRFARLSVVDGARARPGFQVE